MPMFKMNAEAALDQARHALGRVNPETNEHWLEVARVEAAIAQAYATLAQAEAIAARGDD